MLPEYTGGDLQFSKEEPLLYYARFDNILAMNIYFAQLMPDGRVRQIIHMKPTNQSGSIIKVHPISKQQYPKKRNKIIHKMEELHNMYPLNQKYEFIKQDLSKLNFKQVVKFFQSNTKMFAITEQKEKRR